MIGERRVLIAPLDWGLGHATRCIPIIAALTANGFDVMIAASGRTEALLKAEFPELTFIYLKGYEIKYARSGVGLAMKMGLQIPRILYAIYKEHQWLKKVVKQWHIDIIISDNRYGLYHKKLHSIFITHQLRIKTPFLEETLQKINYWFIERFNECWVPDSWGKNNLAGELSHPDKKPKLPLHYIGILSRFTYQDKKWSTDTMVLILLSGPEPQRSILEKKILLQVKCCQEKIVLVRGLPEQITIQQTDASNLTVYNHLPAKELKILLDKAAFVIARCGYSTVMDLQQLGKKAILIPTPGQTEQQYLSSYLMKKHLAYCVSQNEFDLNDSLAAASTFPYTFYAKTDNNCLNKVIQSLKVHQ